MPQYCTCNYENPNLLEHNLVCPNPNCKLLKRVALQSQHNHGPVQEALPLNQHYGYPNHPGFRTSVPVPPIFTRPGMFQVPQVPAVAQNFNPLAPPPPPRPRCERLLYVEPVHPQVPSLMFGQIHQQMNRPAARPEREAFQNPPPGFGFSAPIISANYRFNASRCSWCKLTFGVLPFETLALHDDRADVCKLCLVRTQMTVERIFRRIEFDERANHFGSILCFSERATVLGYTNDMVQCNHCPKEVPRLELVRHVLDFHHGGAFYRCPHNCENFFRSDQMVQHSEQCVRQCVICVANGNLKAAAPQNLVHHIKAVHWQYAVCGITGCNSAYKDPGRMFNHMVENHVWRSVV